MEVAGLREGDTEITVEGNLLTVRGCRADRCPMNKLAFHQMEIRYGRFEKLIRINICFDEENIKARIEEGFLTLLIPKCDPPKPQPVRACFRV
jgi:HSP20 family protein